jgi:hypothetical protein
VFAVPGLGQVQRDAPVAAPGGAGGNVDEITADGGAAGLAVGQAGQGSCGAQQVVRDGGAGQPSRVIVDIDYSVMNTRLCTQKPLEGTA